MLVSHCQGAQSREPTLGASLLPREGLAALLPLGRAGVPSPPLDLGSCGSFAPPQALVRFCTLSSRRRLAGRSSPPRNPPPGLAAPRSTRSTACLSRSSDPPQNSPSLPLRACPPAPVPRPATARPAMPHPATSRAAPCPALPAARPRAPPASARRRRGCRRAAATPAPLPRLAFTRLAPPSPTSARARTSPRPSPSSRRRWNGPEGQGASLPPT